LPNTISSFAGRAQRARTSPAPARNLRLSARAGRGPGGLLYTAAHLSLPIGPMRSLVTPIMSTPRASAVTPAATSIEDVQGHADSRQIPINKVGIKDVYHPVRVKDRSRGEQHTIANFNMYVALPHNFKGTHMSRFVEVLHRNEREISVESFRDILVEMTQKLDAQSGHIEMEFPYFVLKKAPVSGVESLMDYHASLIGEFHGGEPELWLKVTVAATSLCPCSKRISNYGAHNQRSHITIRARVEGHMWLEELIDIAESQASCEVYGILKRPDEKFVTERAYDNPKFVEDIVRDVAVQLNKDDRVRAYVVEAENFESIHNHSAYALIEKDKDGE
jgi:GTP cyclohydrolase IB